MVFIIIKMYSSRQWTQTFGPLCMQIWMVWVYAVYMSVCVCICIGLMYIFCKSSTVAFLYFFPDLLIKLQKNMLFFTDDVWKVWRIKISSNVSVQWCVCGSFFSSELHKIYLLCAYSRGGHPSPGGRGVWIIQGFWNIFGDYRYCVKSCFQDIN